MGGWRIRLSNKTFRLTGGCWKQFFLWSKARLWQLIASQTIDMNDLWQEADDKWPRFCRCTMGIWYCTRCPSTDQLFYSRHGILRERSSRKICLRLWKHIWNSLSSRCGQMLERFPQKKTLFQALFSRFCIIKWIYKRKYHAKKPKICENFAEADKLLILARRRIIHNSMSATGILTYLWFNI